jgi:hypothetical protein
MDFVFIDCTVSLHAHSHHLQLAIGKARESRHLRPDDLTGN